MFITLFSIPIYSMVAWSGLPERKSLWVVQTCCIRILSFFSFSDHTNLLFFEFKLLLNLKDFLNLMSQFTLMKHPSFKYFNTPKVKTSKFGINTSS